MNNIQETLLFPFRDADSRKQFLIACAVVLAGFFIPILPFLLLMGYAVRIMRQVLDEKQEPSMPAWQGSDWSEMLLDGLRLYGAQMVLVLPLLFFMGCGVLSMIGGSAGFATLAEEGARSLAPVSGFFFFIGIASIIIFSILALPYGIIIPAAQAHMVSRRSFAATFEFKEWWQVFRQALGQFVLIYFLMMAGSFILGLVIQVAMVTIILICIVPFLMVPFTAYFMLVTNALYAQAYAAGREALPAA